jgi:hypothetical protein
MSVLFKLPRFDRHTFIAINNDVVPDAEIALASANPLLIAMGAVEGSFAVNKFGENPDILAGTTEDVWDGGAVAGGHYVFPTTASITHIRQATDQVGTDGGATIELQGLDANWDLVVQTADLDAADTTTEVLLTTPLIRVFRKKVLANVVLSADVWSGATGMVAATANSIITAGKNQTLMAIYSVPAGYTAYMSSYYYSVVNSTNKTPTSTEFALWAADRAAGYEFQLKHEVAIPINGPGNQHYFNPPVRFTEKTDIRLSAEPIDQPAYVHAGFDLTLIKN